MLVPVLDGVAVIRADARGEGHVARLCILARLAGTRTKESGVYTFALSLSLSLCVCVCVCVCVYTYIYLGTYVCMYIYTYI